jgi:hypothetical protein
LLAVLGRPAELGDLVALTGRPLDELAPVLDGLASRRLVSEHELEWQTTYEISHPLVSETVYRGVGTARRHTLHRAVGRMLRTGGRLAEASLHLARSAHVGDSEAIEGLCEALRQAEERGTFREALTIVSTLADLLPPGDQRWLEVAGSLAGDADWVVEHKAGLDATKGIRALREIDALLAGGGDTSRRAALNVPPGQLPGLGDGRTGGGATGSGGGYRNPGDRR